MTVWASPVPYYLTGQSPRSGEPESSQRQQQQQQQQQPGGENPFEQPQQGIAGDDLLGANGVRASVRRHSLGSIPSAANIQQKQESWVTYAPTSPERRRSFVSEPSALEGNPFEIYKEPETNNDGLVPNTFYEAGTSYAVKEKPIPLPEHDFFGSHANWGQRPVPVPLHSHDSFDAILGAAPKQLSPIRYNKPAPKVILSPSTAAQINTVFGDLDPFKAEPSPRSRVPLNQLASLTLAEQAEQQRQAQLQQQQQQQWGFFPQGGQQQQQQFQSFQQPQQHFQSYQQQPQPQQQSWDFAAPQPHQQQQNTSAAHFPSQAQGGMWPSATPNFGTSFMPWAPKSPRAAPTPAPAPVSHDMDFGLFSAPEKTTSEKMPTFSSGSSGAPSAGQTDLLSGVDFFDPVAQKKVVHDAFDLDVSGYFGPESERPQRTRTSFYDDEYDGPEDDVNSVNSDSQGEASFELQEDQFHEEGGPHGAYYEVNFTQPSQFGMLLERKDEWLKGEVKRRERTVVTLVVDGGEAERKGVTVGSLVVSINGIDVVDKTYKETLDLIKSPERPMMVLFEKENLKEEVLAGYFFVSKGPFFSTPTTMESWKRKYVVLGGPIAKKNVLQIYDSKKAYHNTVVALFQRKRPHNRVKTYPLTYSYKCSGLEERCMKGNSAPLKLFSFMTPQARFKSIRVASESRKQVQELHDRVRKFAGKR